MSALSTGYMKTTAQQEATILANLCGGLNPFDGFTAAERADYAETVRIENEVRAERETTTVLKSASAPAVVSYVDVWYEDGFKLSNAIRVF